MTQEEILKIAEEVAERVANHGDYYSFYDVFGIDYDENNGATFTAYVTSFRDETSNWDEVWCIRNNGEITFTIESEDGYFSSGKYLNLEDFKENY